jgi:hypothetical protein
MIPETCIFLDYSNETPIDVHHCSVCKNTIDTKTLQQQADLNGISLAVCGSVVYQTVQCPVRGCHGLFIFRSTIFSPFLDMRNLILIPQQNSSAGELEQYHICQGHRQNWSNLMKFQFVSLWDEEFVSEDEFLALIEKKGEPTYEYPHQLFLANENLFWEMLNTEYNQHTPEIRRLCSDKPPNPDLVVLISSSPRTGTNPNVLGEISSDSHKEKKRNALENLIKHYCEEDIFSFAHSKLKSHGIHFETTEDQEKIRLELKKRLYDSIYHSDRNYKTIPDSLLIQDEKAIQASIQNNFQKIVFPIITKYILEQHREKLSAWTKQAKKNRALFINAPMGMGKTYSIAEGLASNPDLSAIIFMPTKRLCQDLMNKLAERISIYQKKFPEPNEIISPDSPGYQFEYDENGDWIDQYTSKYYLNRGIYVFDGINAQECIFYEEIITRYRFGYFRKRDICSQCQKKEQCRFLAHKENMIEHRIIITTHYMYNFFFNQPAFAKWRELTRDFFIIDEDFIFTNCYQPVSMTQEHLVNYMITLTNFLNNSDYLAEAVPKKCFRVMDTLLGMAVKTQQSSIIPPIAPDFLYPKHIKTGWEKSLKEQEEIIPDEVLLLSGKTHSVYVGDYLAVLEYAIQKGFIIHAYNNFKTIYFPNPRKYDFKRKDIPPHVFFDGTQLENRYIRKKIKGLEIENLEIKLEQLPWEVKVYQNLNTDLPKNKSQENFPKILIAISRIFQKHGPYERYFILTNKSTKKILEEYISENHSDFEKVVIEYFGNLRGLNTAKDCNVGIFLGGLILPDTVEIAMSFDLIYRKLKNFPPIPIKITDNIWHWRGRLGTKKYKEDFKEVENLSKAYRHSEYRQALGRTRYLSHPVIFYIFSKDRVDVYEPFIDKTEKLNFCDDIFPPPPAHPNNPNERIEKAVFNWLETNKSVSATDIFKNYSNLRRQTVGKHLKEMKENGLIVPYKKYKYKYRLPNKIVG